MTILDVVNEIIYLGKTNKWFINLDLLTEEDYIYAKGNVITIDTSCLKPFLNKKRTETNEELENYLREMIEVNIPESIDYTIMVDIKNNYI